MAWSSAEAEFRSLAHGICEAIWIKKLFEDLKISVSLPMKIYLITKLSSQLPTIQFYMIELSILRLISISSNRRSKVG